LEGGPPSFTPDFSCSGVTQDPHCLVLLVVSYRALTVSGTPFQGTSPDFEPDVRGSYNPGSVKDPVWAPPRSLAATQGISVDFSSSGY
jgi:hypothetical protein